MKSGGGCYHFKEIGKVVGAGYDNVAHLFLVLGAAFGALNDVCDLGQEVDDGNKDLFCCDMRVVGIEHRIKWFGFSLWISDRGTAFRHFLMQFGGMSIFQASGKPR